MSVRGQANPKRQMARPLSWAVLRMIAARDDDPYITVTMVEWRIPMPSQLPTIPRCEKIIADIGEDRPLVSFARRIETSAAGGSSGSSSRHPIIAMNRSTPTDSNFLLDTESALSDPACHDHPALPALYRTKGRHEEHGPLLRHVD